MTQAAAGAVAATFVLGTTFETATHIVAAKP
jgi:hypothetical protein